MAKQKSTASDKSADKGADKAVDRNRESTIEERRKRKEEATEVDGSESPSTSVGEVAGPE